MSKPQIKQKPVICLIGPTAVGKTEVALELAKKIKAEIISCDSMQVYTGAAIATSWPSKKQRQQIPHHLLDIVSPAREYNAARFSRQAARVIIDIHQRQRVPLIVAGTGLYLKALLDGLFSGPAQNRALRKKLAQQAQRYGLAYLYRRLKKVDPAAAVKIHPHDLRRIIRSLEVYQLTGEPISWLQAQARGIRDQYRVYLFGLQRPREQLYQRIEQRVEHMFRQGLLKEIKCLSAQRLSRTAKSLLGYKEISGFLRGDCSLTEAKELLKKNTRHYAKRQLSWFRKEKDVVWIDVDEGEAPRQIAEKILRLWRD